jgi:plasmid stabilization system protein ParE
VLKLVREQHLVDEAVPQQRVLDGGTDIHILQYVERALADVRHISAQLGVAQDRQLAADLARVLDRVVEAPKLPVQRLPPPDRLHQPQLLEVGDVPEVPGQRAQDRRVDRVQLLVVERRDQRQRPLARLGESVRDRCLGLGGNVGGDGKTLTPISTAL